MASQPKLGILPEWRSGSGPRDPLDTIAAGAYLGNCARRAGWYITFRQVTKSIYKATSASFHSGLE
jgi:hypothetical protein